MDLDVGWSALQGVTVTPPAVPRRLGRLWIRRAGAATYDVMFRPTGNGEFRIATENGLRALLWGATIPEDRIEQAIIALRTDQEHEIPGLALSVDRLRKLGL